MYIVQYLGQIDYLFNISYFPAVRPSGIFFVDCLKHLLFNYYIYFW